MEPFAFQPSARASVAINGLIERFPVHRIYCVGRNFADHAKEMGVEATKDEPVFFMKPADAITQSAQIPYPPQTRNFHHEVELVVALGPDIPQQLSIENAELAIFAYGIGIDLTRRDLQAAAKAKGLPWDTAKGFDDSAPISALILKQHADISDQTRLSLTVNGQLRQTATLGEMIFSVPEIIAALSKLYHLKAGDLIFMGTPAGVAALQSNDAFIATLEGVVSFSARIS